MRTPVPADRMFISDWQTSRVGALSGLSYDSEFYFTRFLWFGNAPGEPLPSIDGFPKGRTNKADSKGHKKERPDIRVLSKNDFATFFTIQNM